MPLIRRTNDGRETLLDPGARVWGAAEAVQLNLVGTPVAMQPSEYIVSTVQQAEVGAIQRLEVRALHNGAQFALRLSWADPEVDRDVSEPGAFADGAAVMFPFGADAPLVTMGSPDQPVNQWHWRADQETPNNVTTAGLGTTYRTPTSRVEARASWQNGTWTVVLLRDLETDDPDHHAPLRADRPLKAAFCVWQGAAQERAGLKAYSPAWTEFPWEG